MDRERFIKLYITFLQQIITVLFVHLDKIWIIYKVYEKKNNLKFLHKSLVEITGHRWFGINTKIKIKCIYSLL